QRFVRAAAALDGLKLAIVGQEPPEKLPREIRERIAAHVRVEDALDADQLERAVREAAAKLGGPVERLIGILEQLQEPLAIVRERLKIPGMDSVEARNFRDKSRMKDLLRQADLPCAKHGLAHSAEEALAFAEDCGYPLVAKPPAGAGARNTVRVSERSELESYVRTIPPRPDAPLLLEEFVVGREHSFDSVSLGGEHVLHSISHYFPTPLEVMEQPWMQWCVVLPRDVSGPEYDDIREAGRKTLDVLGMHTGLTHMEWFRREDGSIAISEVAARPPGAQFTTLLSLSHDRDFYSAWAELVLFDRFTVPERRYAAGAIFLRGQGDGVVKEVHGVRETAEQVQGLLCDVKLPRKGEPQAASYEGQGYVLLRHEDTDVLMDAMKSVLKTLRVELETGLPSRPAHPQASGGGRIR
ncbi:MAG: ATP-grasp domain-containing protein, partial [Planctomycetota bacterium]